MIRKNASRLFVVVAALAALVGVAAVAYYAGNSAAGSSGRDFSSPRFHGMGGMGFAEAGGFGGFWLIGALLLGFLLVLVVLAVAGSGGSSTRPAGDAANPATANPAAANPAAANPAAGVDRLRELTELHDRGALTDEEFTAAKRQLLGL